MTQRNKICAYLLFQLLIFILIFCSCKKNDNNGNGSNGTVIDIDGNSYHTVTIGSQVWMVENLKTTKYNDGNLIPLITDSITWGNQSTPGYSWYENNSATYKNTYGALYNWYTVNTGKLCPDGWHVPTLQEFRTLIHFLGDTLQAGGKMKEMGTTHWYSPNNGATNESGFTGLPGGNRYLNGGFEFLHNYGIWWTSTQEDSVSAYFMVLYDLSAFSSCYNDNMKLGNSVRCIKN